MPGGLQLKRDLGEYAAWVDRIAGSSSGGSGPGGSGKDRGGSGAGGGVCRAVALFRELQDNANVLVIPTSALPSLLQEQQEAGGNVGDMVRFVQLRADYHPAILTQQAQQQRHHQPPSPPPR